MRNEDLRAIFESLEDERGALTPEAVVEEADRDHDSPLGKLFEWDNDKAGAKFRINQARALLRRVEVTYTVERRQIRGLAYIRNPDAASDKAEYISVSRVRQDYDSSHAALVAEFSAAGAHLRRARDLARILGRGDAIDALLQQFDIVDATLREPPEPPPATPAQ